MCNFVANRLCCNAADQAMQVHGGLGYSRHTPFEHIYRHHRRYRITEGAEEIQKRRVAGYMFGFMKSKAPKGVTLQVWVFVDERGRVVADSTRLDPPTRDGGLNRQLIMEASEWLFRPAVQ